MCAIDVLPPFLKVNMQIHTKMHGLFLISLHYVFFFRGLMMLHEVKCPPKESKRSVMSQNQGNPLLKLHRELRFQVGEVFHLGGGFKYFLFSPLFGEDYHVD